MPVGPWVAVLPLVFLLPVEVLFLVPCPPEKLLVLSYHWVLQDQHQLQETVHLLVEVLLMGRVFLPVFLFEGEDLGQYIFRGFLA